MLSCLDLLSCLELAVKSLGSKLPYIAAINYGCTPSARPNKLGYQDLEKKSSTFFTNSFRYAPPQSESSVPVFGYPMGVGPMMMNGCFGSGFGQQPTTTTAASSNAKNGTKVLVTRIE